RAFQCTLRRQPRHNRGGDGMSIADDIRAGRTITGDFDTGADPQGVQRLGAAAAQILEEHPVAAVVCWSGDDEVVFAHAVAVGLGVGVGRAQLSQGRLSFEGQLPARARVALVATQWDEDCPLEPLRRLMITEGSVPAVALSLLTGEGAEGSELATFVLES